MLKLVPFNPTWVTHDKIDIKAIYRRPKWREDEYGEQVRMRDERGLPLWDITTPLPVKQHSKWTAKGFEYITLADRESLRTAALHNTVLDAPGGSPVDWRTYDQHQTGGPWHLRRYMEGLETTTTLAADELRADVEKYGVEVVEQIRRRTEPGFRVPDHLRPEFQAQVAESLQTAKEVKAVKEPHTVKARVPA
jgi:hypothetical protein